MSQNQRSKSVPMAVIVGETASGKSALSLQLAQQFDGEIISADAMTVYRGFDIGTAKPSAKDQALVPHHLLDIVDASKGFSAAQFKQLAQAAIADIGGRGKLPVLVGGTGLYVDSVLFDYDFRPVADTGLRQSLEKQSLEELIALAGKKNLDVSGIDIHNKRRIIRLIESEGRTAKKTPLRNNTLILGLQTAREDLRTRIETRVDNMITQGLENEVRDLSLAYGWDIEPMRSIGYREWRDYFSGQKTLEQTRNDIVIHTMQLAKKQRTWFRRNEHIHWLNNITEAVAYTTTLLNK